jgi:ribosomal protein S18 acetylase RimI-like enzyme
MGASLERSEPVRGATWDDFDRVVELVVRRERAASGVGGMRGEFVRADWELPSFVLGRDNWLCGTTGYAAVSPDGELTLIATDDATGEALLEQAAARARERGLAQLELRPLPADGVHAHVLDRYGFVLQTDVLAMIRAISPLEPEPVWPKGIAVRTFEPDDAAAIHALLDQAYRGWDRTYVPLAHDDWVRAMTGDIEFDPTTWWLADRNGALVGCALWWKSAWLKDIVVRGGDRGHGLGTALIRHGLAEFARRGVRRAGLKVDAANPTGAPRLYERLGFTTQRREQIWALSL